MSESADGNANYLLSVIHPLMPRMSSVWLITERIAAGATTVTVPRDKHCPALWQFFYI